MNPSMIASFTVSPTLAPVLLPEGYRVATDTRGKNHRGALIVGDHEQWRRGWDVGHWECGGRPRPSHSRPSVDVAWNNDPVGMRKRPALVLRYQVGAAVLCGSCVPAVDGGRVNTVPGMQNAPVGSTGAFRAGIDSDGVSTDSGAAAALDRPTLVFAHSAPDAGILARVESPAKALVDL